MMEFEIYKKARSSGNGIMYCVGCKLISRVKLAEIELLYWDRLHISEEMLQKF